MQSFDHFVGEGQEGRRNSETEFLGGLAINDKLEFSRLLNWEVARLFAAQLIDQPVCERCYKS
jgi:hypothetical protein